MSWSVDIDAVLAPLLPLVAGMAVCRSVEQIVGRDAAALKWPNDVLVPEFGERKLVGILAEAAPVGGSSSQKRLRVIVGMGMNVDLGLDDAPADVAARAIDLSTLVLAGGVAAEVDRALLVDTILDACDEGIGELESSTSQVLDAYRARCLTIGRSIRFETSAGELAGEAVGIGDDGSLLLRTGDGVIHPLTAGDAHHVG